MTEQTQDATEASDVTETTHHEEVRANGERVIVVNSQPRSGDTELPPRQMRSLGAVTAHATDPVSGDSQPRRGSTRRGGSPLVAMLTTAVPLAAAAWGITFLEERTTVLAATAALVVLWLAGIVAAWRGLGPTGRDSRGGIWLGRAIGLVLGALAAVYLLLDTVSPLL